jgi:hypothetical protein
VTRRKNSTYKTVTPATLRKDGRPPRKAIQIQPGKTDDESEQILAAAMTSPDRAASRVIAGTEGTSGLGELIDLPQLMAERCDSRRRQ